MPWFSVIKDFGWFIGAPIAGILYYVIAKDRVIVLPEEDRPTGEPPARAG